MNVRGLRRSGIDGLHETTFEEETRRPKPEHRTDMSARPTPRNPPREELREALANSAREVRARLGGRHRGISAPSRAAPGVVVVPHPSPLEPGTLRRSREHSREHLLAHHAPLPLAQGVAAAWVVEPVRARSGSAWRGWCATFSRFFHKKTVFFACFLACIFGFREDKSELV